MVKKREPGLQSENTWKRKTGLNRKETSKEIDKKPTVPRKEWKYFLTGLKPMQKMTLGHQ